MRQLTANLLQDYFREQGVDYLSLDSKSQRKLERKHSQKFKEWNINRKMTLALKRKSYFNKKGIPLLRARIELLVRILEKFQGKFDLKLYSDLYELIVQGTRRVFFVFADEEFEKHKSVDLIMENEDEIRADVMKFLYIPRKWDYVISDWFYEDYDLREELENRYSKLGRFKRLFTRNASADQLSRLENRIARLEKHNRLR